RKQAKNEVEVRYVGRVNKLAAPSWEQKRHRPLRLGTSIGHHRVTAGMLGAVVRPRGGGADLLLSNNHVLAHENRGKAGDAVLQPGAYDGGAAPDSAVGTLATVVRLKKAGKNLVDSATAAVAAGVEVDPHTIKGLGKLAGLGDPLLDEGA